MILPFDRRRLRERNVMDAADELEECRRRSPTERLARTLELSELVRAFASSTGSDRVTDERVDLGEKARLYAEPLRVAARRR